MLRHRCILFTQYPPEFEAFFSYHLGVKNVSLDHVIWEFELWSEVDDRDHQYLKSLVLALNAGLQAAVLDSGKDTRKERLKAMNHRAMIPVYRVTSNGVIRRVMSLVDYSQEWYFVDAIRLKEAFHDKVWLADFSPEETLKLKTLMNYIEMVFFTSHPLLTKVVKEVSRCGGTQGVSEALTRQLRWKGKLLEA